MCGGSFGFWFCVVLLFTSSSNTPRNFTSDNEEDNIWKETYNHTNFIRNKTNNNNKNHIVPYEKCSNITSIQLCCPLGDRLVDENCIASENEYVFPNIYSYSNNSIQSGNKKVDELFPLIVQNPCHIRETIRFYLYPDYFYLNYFKYMFFANSSLYLPYFDIFVESTSYCLAVVDHNQFDAIICSEAATETIDNMTDNLINEIFNELIILLLSCRIVSMLCLLTIFVVYSILPELRNIHSFMLRKYCSLLFFAYIIDTISSLPLYSIQFDIEDFPYFICVIIALVNYFCYLSSFFWLSAMSFDIWWTFRDFRLLQRNVKQERKKLIYSIFAWGSPFIFTIIYIITDFVPKLPKNLIRPEFCVDSFWYHEDAASRLYFYGPKSVCVISSICLSIYTALKIMRYEKDTARHLRDSESRFYNDNKRWLNLYLRLFIMLFIIMTINWIMKATLEFSSFTNFANYDDADYLDLLIKLLYVLRSTLVMDTMQDIGMFIIFVCKKTIMRQLLKRFCQNCKCFSKTST